MATATYEQISDDPAVQAFYEQCRDDGESHNMAEICAFRRAPGLSTDTTYMAGVGTLLQQCGDNEAELKRLVKAAKRHGHTPNMHSIYNPTLAPQFGHPDGFVPHDSPKAHVLDVCKRRGKDCTGLVNYKAPQRDKPLKPAPRLNKRIVNDYVRRAVKADPGLRQRKGAIANLRQEVVEKHGFSLDG